MICSALLSRLLLLSVVEKPDAESGISANILRSWVFVSALKTEMRASSEVAMRA